MGNPNSGWRRALAGVALAIMLVPLAHAVSGADFVFRNTRPDGSGTPYRVYVPPSWQAHTHLPLIVYLHGSGEVGSDNERPLKYNATKLIEWLDSDTIKQQPVLMAVPQSRWTQWDPAEIAEVVASIDVEFGADRDRIYLTGLSTGGSAVWDTLKAFPKLFAAAVPICASAATADIAKIARVPVWIFHGSQDHETDPRFGDGDDRVGPHWIVEALLADGGDPRYTEYPDLGHKVWDRAYATPQLPAWLLSQRRSARESGFAQRALAPQNGYH